MKYRYLPHFKNIPFTIFRVFGLFLISYGHSFADNNYYLEKKISDALIEEIDKESIVWLKTEEKQEVFALFSSANISNLQGGIIILSDLFQTPDWPIVTHDLRVTLPNYGWETLSIQLPIPISTPSNTDLDDTYKLTTLRIESAINFFQTKNINNIVLIGISQSANFALKFTAALPNDNTDIQALVFLRAFDSSWLTSSDLVKQITIPMLDIYPEHDSGTFQKSAKKRLIASNFAGKLKSKPRFLDLSKKVQKLAINKTGNLRYRQKVIIGANYHFDKLKPRLIKAIRGWLSVYASGQEVIAEKK